jgi:hypothetical protein
MVRAVVGWTLALVFIASALAADLPVPKSKSHRAKVERVKTTPSTITGDSPYDRSETLQPSTATPSFTIGDPMPEEKK